MTQKSSNAKTRQKHSSKARLSPSDPVVVIEGVKPAVDRGAFPAKGIAGRPFKVQANVFKDGHDHLSVVLAWREKNENAWTESPMKLLVNDRWEGVFVPEKNSRYFYRVEGWMDPLRTWLSYVEKKASNCMDLAAEIFEGERLLGLLREKLGEADKAFVSGWIETLRGSLTDFKKVLDSIREEEFARIVREHPIKTEPARSTEFELVADRLRAEFGGWYEMFPRSQGPEPGKSGTFRDCIKRLPDIRKMGFDVVYLPPIHPIGHTHRKGPNNSLTSRINSPGSPWAIGNEGGGHKSLHPQLGNWDDFESFVRAASDLGMEIALDFAIQCSPDHPYVKTHPEWFYRLPDGTIRYAENPPKKYQDIYPLNFMTENRQELWDEMKSILLFWIGKGIRIFRVDNPHTKPFNFWQWLIQSIQEEYSDVIFLAEAFTRPTVMKYLAKVGFTQSYTYFTWRNSSHELSEYLRELTGTGMRHYFRPNFFANTPDILSDILQKGGRPAFKMRLILAATLSASYGIYSGFEFCENTPLKKGSEEYLNSEKYEIRVRDWDAPGNIKDFIARVNRARRENPALQQTADIEFFETESDHLIAYGKWNQDRSNVVVTIVNTDPLGAHEGLLHFPAWKFGLDDETAYQVKDLIVGEQYSWTGQQHYIKLDPSIEPAHIFLLRK